MKKLFLLSISLFVLFACGGGQKESKTASLTTLDNGNLLIKFEQGPAEGNFTSRLDSLGDSRTFVFEAKEGQILTASVNAIDSTQVPNVRFNQIISPSGEADGPFGASIEYNLATGGQWKLIVGESLMLGEPYTGEFTINISVKQL